MADVTVEFGATDTGLEKTLKAVQGELNGQKFIAGMRTANMFLGVDLEGEDEEVKS